MISKIIIIMLAAIPVAAIIDYFPCRKRLEKIYGSSKWTHFVIPCTLKSWIFMLGVLVGYVLASS